MENKWKQIISLLLHASSFPSILYPFRTFYIPTSFLQNSFLTVFNNEQCSEVSAVTLRISTFPSHASEKTKNCHPAAALVKLNIVPTRVSTESMVSHTHACTHPRTES